MTVEPLLDAGQAHAILKELGYRISLKAIYAMAAEGRMPSHKDGRYRYYRRSELMSWVERRMNDSSTANGKSLAEKAAR